MLCQIFKKGSSSKKRRKVPVRKTDVFSSTFYCTELIFGTSRVKKCQTPIFFFKNCFFLKIWHSKSGYRQLRRPKSLPRMRFSSLYDASPPRNITVCVFDLDLGRKKTSLRKGAPDLSKKKQKCKLISYQYYKIFVLKSQQKPSGK